MRPRIPIPAGIMLFFAVGAGAVALSAREAAHARLATTRFMLTALASWDALHQRLDPHPPFTREPKIVDLRPLSEQARAMWQDLDARFLVDQGRLLVTTTPPVEIGDLCLWQGVYTAAAALEYDLRRDDKSRRRAELAFDGLRTLASRGRPIARAVLPADLETEPPGKWYFRAGDLQWKEDASIDSAAGWVFGAVIVYELLPSRRAQAVASLKQFADALIEEGYVLRNSDGKRTRYSAMGGAFVSSPVGVMTSLAALTTLERAGAGEQYVREREHLVLAGQDIWGAYASGPGLWRNVTTNHNIATLALVSALLAEREPARWRLYAHGLLRLDRLTEKMGNAFWIYLTEWTLARRPALTASLESAREYRRFRGAKEARLRRARVSMLEWDYPRGKNKEPVANSRRADLEMIRWRPAARLEAAEPLPIHERPGTDFVWQRSPYQLDGWTRYHGRPQEFVPLDFLIAYALGRLSGALSSVD